MLKFTYGVMGSSKTAQALITKFNYEQNNFQVILLKPKIDTRSKMVKSRIGLKSNCVTFSLKQNLLDLEIFDIDFDKETIIIVDECQFCTKEQIEQLKTISETFDVFCYGLKVGIDTELFEGSKRLIELADELERIPHICECGAQAITNLLYDGDKLLKHQSSECIKYTHHKSLCYKCYKKYLDMES